MKQRMLRQEGQSIIIVAFALVLITALLALVVDAGNTYVQRRQIQNAADSGAQAGAVALAQKKQNIEVQTAINKYLTSNGVDPNKAKAYYVVENAQHQYIPVRCSGCTILGYGAYNQPPETLQVDGVSLPVIGIQVDADKSYSTFFAGVVGWKQMQVSAATASYAKCGACSANNLFPMTLSQDTFMENGVPVVHTEQGDPSHYYVLLENKQIAPGNFAYLSWNNDASEATLTNNMAHPEGSGVWAVNDDVSAANGTMTSSAVYSAIQAYVNSQKPVAVPIYDSFVSSKYNIKGFARFKITCIYKDSSKHTGNCLNTDLNHIEVKFQQWTDSQAVGGCADFGGCTVRSAITTNERALVGSLKLNRLTVVDSPPTAAHVPVDVSNVLDISYSMRWNFDGTTVENNQKLNAAKTALTSFNNNIRPDLGDQLALVTFPIRWTGSYYYQACPNKDRPTSNPSINFYQDGEVKKVLGGTTDWINQINNTINSLTANNNTPTAGAIKKARLELLGTRHRAGSVAVMILATDGRANVRVDTNKYAGNNSDYLDCNLPSVTDMTNEAMIAKGDNNRDGLPDVLVFVIAVGQEWRDNPVLTAPFEAVATQDTDPAYKHFFAAANAADMSGIYQQIANRVQHIGNETCQVIQTEAFAPGAFVRVVNTTTGESYTATTTSTGEFVIKGDAAHPIQPGTYEFQSATVNVDGMTYDVFTDGLGGAASASKPTVVVGPGSGTYKTELFLKTSTTVSCPAH